MKYLCLDAKFSSEGKLYVVNGPTLELSGKYDWIPDKTKGWFLVRQVNLDPSEFKIIYVLKK